MSSLDNLYFGKDDAESDFAKGGLLRAGFLRTRSYDEALSGRKALIVGRKGSGKSAVCIMLKSALTQENRVSLVTPDEISAEEIRRFQLPGISSEQSKQLIWRYVFLIQIAKFLISRPIASGDSMSPEVARVRHFLVENGEVDDFTIVERFWKIIERLKGKVSLEAFGFKASAEVDNSAPGLRSTDRLDRLQTSLINAARKLGLDSSSPPFHILVDQIEKVWSNDRESDAMVVGLLQAVKDIRAEFDFIHCTVFLRTDIYEKLQFGDRDKFRGDEFHIDWDKEKLLDLIETRAQASSGKAFTPSRLWEELFPATTEETDIKTFLVSRTLMRPRDLIQLCNACRDTAKTSGHDEIAEKDLKQSLGLYSNWKLIDLQNEWMVNYPFLADTFVLLANGSYLFRRTNFEAKLGAITSDLVSRYPTVGRSISAEALLSIYYSIGLIGVIRSGSANYYYDQKNERTIQPHDCEFVIHPCFRNALQCTSALDFVPFEGNDLELIRGRFRREIRFGHAIESLSPRRGFRAVGYVGDYLERLRVAVGKSSLPDELRREIAANLTAMQSTISNAMDSEDGGVVYGTMRRIHWHIAQMRKRLEAQDWFSVEQKIGYQLTEVDKFLERFLVSGELDEFRT